ncbi:MAG: hypothetical protein ACOYZ6_03685 [Chloroflexota bacterium]
MDTNTFYALFSTTCLALVGLWWNAVAGRIKAFKEPGMKQAATGVYFSFLIPGMMGLGAQIAGVDSTWWRAVFIVGALAGIIVWMNIIRNAQKIGAGFLRGKRWIVIALYALILFGSLGADKLLSGTGITPIQVEAIWLCLLVLAGHAMSWETLMVMPLPES